MSVTTKLSGIPLHNVGGVRPQPFFQTVQNVGGVKYLLLDTVRALKMFLKGSVRFGCCLAFCLLSMALLHMNLSKNTT